MTRVTLTHPIHVGSIEMKELAFRRPDLGILADATESNLSELKMLIALIAETATCPAHPDVPMTVALARKLDPEDLPAIGAVINGFFPNGLATGGKG